MILKAEQIRNLRLQVGDFYQTKGRGLAGWASERLFVPTTDRFHAGLVWMGTPDGDRVILESLGSVLPFSGTSGITPGRLSMYAGRDIKFYRVNGVAQMQRSQAPLELTRYGRSNYDYWLAAKMPFYYLIAEVKVMAKERKSRKLRADDFSYRLNSAMWCTEAVDMAYILIGYPIIPILTLPLPCALRQAELGGETRELGEEELLGED